VYDLRRLRFLRARRRFAWSWEGVTVYEHRARRLRRPLRFVPNAAIVAVDRLVLARLFGNGTPRLRPDLEARLRNVYAGDVLALARLLDRDLTAWRQPSVTPGSLG
jgi:hypothetical protein